MDLLKITVSIFLSIQLFDVVNLQIDIAEAFEYAANEFWVVRLKEEVDAGNYTLTLNFNGSLVIKMNCLFKC